MRSSSFKILIKASKHFRFSISEKPFYKAGIGTIDKFQESYQKDLKNKIFEVPAGKILLSFLQQKSTQKYYDSFFHSNFCGLEDKICEVYINYLETNPSDVQIYEEFTLKFIDLKTLNTKNKWDLVSFCPNLADEIFLEKFLLSSQIIDFSNVSYRCLIHLLKKISFFCAIHTKGYPLLYKYLGTFLRTKYNFLKELPDTSSNYPIFILFLLYVRPDSLGGEELSFYGFLHTKFSRLITCDLPSYPLELSLLLIQFYFSSMKGDKALTYSLCKNFGEVNNIDFFIRASLFWLYFMETSSDQDVAVNSKLLHKFRYSATSLKNLLDLESYLKNLSALLGIYFSTHRNRKILQNQYRIKSVSRTLENAILVLAEFFFESLKEKNYFLPSNRLSLVIGVIIDISEVYSYYGINVPHIYFDTIDIIYRKNITNTTSKNLTEILNFVFKSTSIDKQKFYVDKLSYLLKHALENNYVSVVQDLLSCKCINLGYALLENKNITEILENYADKILKFPIYVLKLCTIFQLVRRKFDSKIVEYAYYLYRNNKEFHYSLKRIYLNCLISQKFPYRQGEIEKIIEELSRPNTSRNTYRSFLQIQLEVTLERNGLKFEFEKCVAGFLVDLFIQPNIIVEVIGNVHIVEGDYDLMLKNKIWVLRQLGYKTILFRQEDIKRYDKKAIVLNQIINLVKGFQ